MVGLLCERAETAEGLRVVQAKKNGGAPAFRRGGPTMAGQAACQCLYHQGHAKTLVACRRAAQRHDGAGRVGCEHVRIAAGAARSEEHTSELQSIIRSSSAVFCLPTQTRSRPHA